jgi:hypothetical protein
LGHFFRLQKLSINYNKNGLGYILGDFFTNSSGHPANNACTKREKGFLETLAKIVPEIMERGLK